MPDTSLRDANNGGLPMTLAVRNRQPTTSTSLVPWLNQLYALIIDARQRQADARVAAHLRDLPDDVIRKLGVSVEAVEATLRVREHRPNPPCLHGRVTTARCGPTAMA
jgi:hypothetical protein